MIPESRPASTSCLSLGILLLFIVLFAPGASKPLQLDNMDFPAVAAQTAVRGVPVYYRGEQNPQALGIYHPPLYIYLLAAWIRIFGFGETQVRMFGMICALLQGLIAIALLQCLFGRETVARWRPWFWMIYLLNPYTLQSSTIADIDTTIYGPLLCLALLAVIRLSWRDGLWRADPIRRREYVLVAAAITLCLWAKLTTVLIVFPFIFFLLIPRLSISRAMVTTAALTIAGIAAFLLTYFGYGKLTDLNVNFTFAFTWRSFLDRGSSQVPGLAARLMDFRGNALMMVPFMVRWTGLLPWMAGLGALVWAFLRLWRNRDVRAAHYGLLILVALLTTAYYCGKTATFGAAPFKYVFVFWGLTLTAPVLLAFSGPKLWTLPEPENAPWIREALWIAVPLAVGGFCATMLVGDPILTGWAGRREWFVVLPALAFVLGAMIPSRAWGRGLLVAGFSAYCGVQLAVALAQSKAVYATTYEYGQTGFTDTVAFLKLNTGPDDVIASMKDIGFRAGRRYYENYQALYGDDQTEQWFIRAIASGKVVYAVFTEGRGEDQLVIRPSLQKWIAEHCDLVRSFGNYRIYKYRPTPDSSN